MKTSREKVDDFSRAIDGIAKAAQDAKVIIGTAETSIIVFRDVASKVLFRYLESQRIAREQKILRQKQFWLGLTYSESKRLL